MDAGPLVRWAGGKGSLLTDLLSRVPTTMGTYCEPFAGGAALFFAVASEAIQGQRSVQRFVVADQNADLIATYRTVQRDVDALIAVLDTYRDDPDLYYEVRALDPERMGDVARAARTIFLNRACFNGLWRVNARGKFNVPYGHRGLPRICNEAELRAAASLFARIAELTFLHADYRDVLASLGDGDFAYCDPPYVPSSKTANFSAYARRGFGEAQHRDLADRLSELHARGVRVMLSNADTTLARSLYSRHRVESVRAPRSIASDGTKRAPVGELIVTTFATSF